jgi:hypothetical protein
MGELDKDSQRQLMIVMTVGAIVLVLVPIVIALAWLATFLSWLGVTTWPKVKDTNQFLIVTGICVTMPCAIAGLGAMFGWFQLSKTAKFFCCTTVVGGIVAVALGWFKTTAP